MHNGYSETARVHVGRAAVRVTKVYWPGFSARKYCAVGVSWRTGPRFRVQRRRVSEDWALALTHWPAGGTGTDFKLRVCWSRP